MVPEKENSSPVETPNNAETADWNFAQIELLEKQGIDLKLEMQQRLNALETQFKKEKETADQIFEEQRKVSSTEFEIWTRKAVENSDTKFLEKRQ